MRCLHDARSYIPGSDVIFVGPCGALVLPAAAGPAVDVLWPLIRDGAEIDLLLEALATGGMRAMPPFALLHGLRIVLRGTGQARLGSGGTAITGAPFLTWAEHVVDEGQPVRLSLGDGDDPAESERDGLPVVAGVVRASAVSVAATAEGDPARAEDEALPAHLPLRIVPPMGGDLQTAAAPAQPDVAERVPARTSEASSVTPVTAVSAVPGSPSVTAVPVPPAPEVAAPLAVAHSGASPDTVAPDWTGQGTPAGMVDAVPDFGGTPSDEESYDHLFGDTVHRSLEDAGVRPAAADEQEGPPVAVPDTDHDGSTILRADLAALRGDRTPAAATSGSAVPQVLGVRCELGHANPPSTPRCRSCGAPVPDLDPVLLPRPSLGRLCVSDGSQAELDRTVLIGRQPTANRFSRDETPHLLIVGGQQQDISRTHVEVQVEDWNVLVVDRSSNGTWLVRPGADPQRLHSGDPVLVFPGSVIDLGDGVTVRYEAGES